MTSVYVQILRLSIIENIVFFIENCRQFHRCDQFTKYCVKVFKNIIRENENLLHRRLQQSINRYRQKFIRVRHWFTNQVFTNYQSLESFMSFHFNVNCSRLNLLKFIVSGNMENHFSFI